MDGNIFDIERIIFCLVCFSYLLLVLFLNCWLGRLFWKIKWKKQKKVIVSDNVVVVMVVIMMMIIKKGMRKKMMKIFFSMYNDDDGNLGSSWWILFRKQTFILLSSWWSWTKLECLLRLLKCSNFNDGFFTMIMKQQVFWNIFFSQPTSILMMMMMLGNNIFRLPLLLSWSSWSRLFHFRFVSI